MDFLTSYWLWILVALFVAGMYLSRRGHAKHTRTGQSPAIVGCGHGYFDGRSSGETAPRPLKMIEPEQGQGHEKGSC